MANVSYKLKDLEKKKTIKIGYVGENNHMHVRIDCEEVFKEYPNAAVTMAITPPEGEDYPKVVTRDGNVVEWTVANSDVAAEGYGEFQMTFTEGEVIRKTVTASFEVIRSIVGNGTAPSGIDDFLTDANAKLAEVDEAIQDAEDAASHAPRVGTSGYWETWDAETGAYVSTGTKAQGEQGDPGSPGDPTQLIDDTAGEGATGKTWSANKLDETTGQLLTAIQGKYTKPSGGIPATDMSEKVQNTLSGVGKSENRDGIVQSTDTATKNITSGQYVIWKGSLYTASENIATGETLSLSNLNPVSDGGFNALRDEIKQIGKIKAYKKYVQQEQSTGGVWIELDEPVDIEEGDEIEILVYQSDKATSGRSWSNTASWNGMAIQNRARNSILLQDIPYLNSDRPAMRKIWKKNGYTKYVTITNNALAGFGVDFPDNFDSFSRVQLDPVSSTLKAGCTVEITVRKTI